MPEPITVVRHVTEYQALTAAGALIVGARFGNAAEAAAWFEEHATEWPGCRVRLHRVRETDQTLFQHETKAVAA
jgi:hypothetical protein